MSERTSRIREGQLRKPQGKTNAETLAELEERSSAYVEGRSTIQNLKNIADVLDAGTRDACATVNHIEENRSNFTAEYYETERLKVFTAREAVLDTLEEKVEAIIAAAAAEADTFRSRRSLIAPANDQAQRRTDSLVALARAGSLSAHAKLLQEELDRDDKATASHLLWLLKDRLANETVEGSDRPISETDPFDSLVEEATLRLSDEGPFIVAKIDEHVQRARNLAADVVTAIEEENRWIGSTIERAEFVLPGGETVKAHEHVPVAEPAPGMHVETSE